MFDIQNRRYIGSKATLSDWIFENIPNKYKAELLWIYLLELEL